MSHLRTSFVVLKFGGTSVSSKKNWLTISNQVKKRLEKNLRPVVVCSALTGVSDQLEKLCFLAKEGDWENNFNQLKNHHLEFSKELGLLDENLLEKDFENIRRWLLGISLTGEVSPRLQARIMGMGEILSTRLGAAFFSLQGLKIKWEDARTLFQVADPFPDTNHHNYYLSNSIDPIPQEEVQTLFKNPLYQGVITQGFIAGNPAGETLLLGRGGSDVSAAYFAVLLNAVHCEIWTDVPGMFTADPRRIPQAFLLKNLDYQEAQEIASTGAKVLHPRCLTPLEKFQIPLQILSTPNPEIDGTRIFRFQMNAGPQVKALSLKKSVTLISMDNVGMWGQYGVLADLFGVFKEHGISIDLVATSETNVTVSLDTVSNAGSSSRIPDLVAQLSKICSATVISPCAALSLVGNNIRAILYRLGPVLEAFQEKKIHMMTQAANDLNFTFVVDEKDAETILKRLHLHLFQRKENHPVFGPTWSDLFKKGLGSENQMVSQESWWRGKRERLLDLAKKKSPLYVYDAQTIQDKGKSLKSLKNVDKWFYAMKANSNPEILKFLLGEGFGFECVSEGEIQLLIDLFGPHLIEQIFFTPNFAPKKEYQFALNQGIRITLDSLHPLTHWGEIFKGKDIFLRVDPGFGQGHHDHVKTGGIKSKFGIYLEELPKAAQLVIEAGARVVGLHCHRGSGILSPEGWSETLRILLTQSELFDHLKIFNIGGGLGIPEKPNQNQLDLTEVDQSLSEYKKLIPGLEIWMEPGRYLVAESGILLAQVTQLKQKGEVHFIGLNTGMNSLIRPSLYGAHHPIFNLTRLEQKNEKNSNVVGPICESGDTLGHERLLPKTEEGDIFLIANGGAYGFVMGSHYNKRPPAEEVFLGPEFSGSILE